MKIVSNKTVAIFFIIYCSCNSRNIKSNLEQKPFVLKVNVFKNLTTEIKYDSLNWAKIDSIGASCLVLEIAMPELKKVCLIKKEFLNLRTGFMFNYTEDKDNIKLMIGYYNYASSVLFDSLVFIKANENFLPKEVFYIQQSLWGHLDIYPYILQKNDTVILENKMLDSSRNQRNYLKTDEENILKIGNIEWDEGDNIKSKNHYLEFIKIVKANKLNDSLIPKYVFKRLSILF